MARAAVAFAEIRATLPAFTDVPLPGLTLSMANLAAEIIAQTGQPLRTKPFEWWLIRLLSPFWGLTRELLKMRDLFDLSHSLSPETLARLLPDFKPAPLNQVVAEHLHHA